jgi:membrane-bound lytic murein transglycosylase D
MKRILMRLVFIALLLSKSILFLHASDGKRDYNLKKALPLTVTKIDTANGVEVSYLYPDEDLNYLMAEKLDSLVNTWYVQNAFKYDSLEVVNIPDSLKIPLPDSVYIERLKNINSFIDLSYNKTVKNFISLYTIKRREQVCVMLGLAKYYFPLFEETLDKYDMPLELKYMAIIESALNPRALSRAGASGLWQFMYGTAKMYKVEINSFVDGRRDPLAATDAAARHLKSLYRIYGDWHLVIAAYNCGAGNVNKAIRRSGGTRNYWDIYYRLPRETRGYVPAFIAATYAMHYSEEHLLTAKEPEFRIITDSIHINNYMHFKQLSEVLEISIDEIRSLNPQYRHDIIPATEKKSYVLKLPVEHISQFIDLEKQVYAHNREKHFPNNQIVKPKSSGYYKYNPVDIKGKDKDFYTVKSGDNVGYISSWFKVRASDLRYWNNINRNLIRVGQKLVIYVPTGKGEYFRKFNSMSLSSKQASIGKKAPTLAPVSGTTAFVPGKYKYYTVRRGDNLWSIARKFPGISNKDIINANKLKNEKNIYPGQKLKIPQKA